MPHLKCYKLIMPMVVVVTSCSLLPCFVFTARFFAFLTPLADSQASRIFSALKN